MHQHSQINVSLDDAASFDQALHGTDMRVLADFGDLRLITKHGATVGGKVAVCLTFSVMLDGRPARAQTVTSMRLFKGLLKILDAKYDDEGMPR